MQLPSTDDPVFTAAFNFLMVQEGVYSNDPGDAGGETMYGNAQASWPDRLSQMPADVRATMPALVKDLTLAQAKLAYYTVEWTQLNCASMPPGLTTVLLDAAVNNGAGQAIRWLQTVVGAYVDGDYGPKTLVAVAASVAHGWEATAVAFQATRLRAQVAKPTWQTYQQDYSRRLCQVLVDATHMPQAAAASTSA